MILKTRTRLRRRMALEANPYLNFDGDAAKAIAFYEKALGTTAQNVMRFGEIPGGQQAPPAARDRIMHAVLPFGEARIMVSDGRPDQAVKFGDNVHIALHFDDAAQQKRVFDALAAGGNVTMPLQDTFWGARFGMLSDRFGVHWMFNHETRKA